MQKARSLADALGGPRWVAAVLVAGSSFAAAALSGLVLPAGFGTLLVAAFVVSPCVLGGGCWMLYFPSDQVLASGRETLEQTLPGLRQAWLEQQALIAAAREAERARQAAEREDRRIRKAEAREAKRVLKAAAQEAEAKRRAKLAEQTRRRNGTAVCIFENRTDSPALVKLIGPIEECVQVESGSSGTIASIPAGRYIVRIRYGTSEGNYSYAEGNTFTIDDNSRCTMTLHKVAGGNYGSRSIGKNQF